MRDFSEEVGLSPSAIRFYEDLFFIKAPKERPDGNRYFSTKDLKKFHWIARASVVYKLQVIKIALMTLPVSRFQKQELLTNEELTKIYATIRAIGRSHPDQARPTR